MRFEYFLTLLKNSMFIIGNSSAGIREAPHFGVPSVDIGTRQNGRVKCDSVINIDINSQDITSGIDFAVGYNKVKFTLFGNGNSALEFHSILNNKDFWNQKTQKKFIDIKF